MKKRGICWSVVLALLLAVVVPLGDGAEAAAKVKFSYTKIDDSMTLPDGTFANYFRYPKLKGSAKGISKINSALKKEGNKFIQMSGYTKSDIAEFIERDYANYNQKCEYFNTADGKAAYNDGSVFSVQISSAWFAGGVSNYDLYGDTFNVKTGKKLKLTQVVSEDYDNVSSLRGAIYDELKTRYDTSVADAFLEKYNSEKSLKAADFYLDKKGTVVVCFRTYDISDGAAGCLTVELESRF